MSVVIKTIKDYFNNYVYPKTKTKAVYDDSNNRLDTTLSTVVHFDNDSSSGTISDPVLKQSDIATTLGTSDTVPASQKLVNTVNTNLGSPSSASSVTGADAFSKISTLNSDLTSVDSALTERVKCKTLLKGLSTAGWYTFATFPSNGSDIGEAVEITISSQYNNSSNFVASALLLRAFLVSSLTLCGMLARTSKVVTKIRTTDDNKVQFYYDASVNNNIKVIMSGPLSIVTPSDEITLDTATHTTVSEITL